MEETTSCKSTTPTAEKNKEKPIRRVGTFTFGWVMIVTGIVMILGLFFPKADLRTVLRLSPVILISIGVEVLLGSRGSSRLKYDWAAMLLCFTVVCAAMGMYAVAWAMLYHPGWVHL